MRTPATVLGRVAVGIEKYIEPVYRWLGYAGALVIMLATATLIYAAFARMAGNALDGKPEVEEYGLLLMVALAMGIEHFGHEKMTVDALARLLPKKVQGIIAPIIFALVTAILVIAVWQLIEYGMGLQESGEWTRSLNIVKYPFVYILAGGVFTLIPIYVARLLTSIDRLVKR